MILPRLVALVPSVRVPYLELERSQTFQVLSALSTANGVLHKATRLLVFPLMATHLSAALERSMGVVRDAE